MNATYRLHSQRDFEPQKKLPIDNTGGKKTPEIEIDPKDGADGSKNGELVMAIRIMSRM